MVRRFSPSNHPGADWGGTGILESSPGTSHLSSIARPRVAVIP
ncbi:MAG: hypothetical protein WB501_06410 [Nitrososphaeraceae archaeon]